MAKTKKPRKTARGKRYTPMLINYPAMAIKHRMAASMLASNSGSLAHWDSLATAYNLLCIGAARRELHDVLSVCKSFFDYLKAARISFDMGGTWNWDEDAQAMAGVFLTVGEDFWNRQGGKFFNECLEMMRGEVEKIPEGSISSDSLGC